MVLTLDGRGPRYAQITRALVSLIRRGVLAPGTRAPATRELARDAGCSRNLVLLAYEQLRLEGYLVGRERTGTFVAPGLGSGSGGTGGSGSGRGIAAADPRRVASTRSRSDGSARHLSLAGRRLVRAAADAMRPIQHQPPCPIDFMYGLSEPDDRLVRRMRPAVVAPLRDRAFQPSGSQGDPELRQQIAMRLRSARAISRTADEIVITSGTQQAVDLCVRLLISPGDRVVVEDPGYDFAHSVFVGAGARMTYARVDGDGLDPDVLPRKRHGARLVYVTPSHQFPTGAVMSAARRHALVSWARRTDGLIIEDDYDGEFRYAGQPIPALAGLDPERVIYCGTFTKSLFPSCRVGYLALPPALVRPVVEAKWITDHATSRFAQRALAHLMASGDFDRHVRRVTRRYRERRDTLVASLRHHLGSNARIEGASAGLHLAVWLPTLRADRVHDLVAACRGRGVGVYPMARHAKRKLPCAALLLGYGLVDPGQITRGVAVLAEEFKGDRPRSRQFL